MSKQYLLIDFGNSYIKAGLYDCKKAKIIKTFEIKKTTNAKNLISKFKNLTKVNKVIEVATSRPSFVQPFNNHLTKLLKTKIKIINVRDFNKTLNLSIVDKNVVIGTDILICLYYIKKVLKTGAIISLGTVYYAIVGKGNKFINCYLLPSTPKSLDNVSKQSNIPSSLIPKVYDKTIGKNTPSCFSTGVNLSMDGFISNLIKQNHIKSNQIVISGGDVYRFPLICRKYKVIKYIVLDAIALFIKEKHW